MAASIPSRVESRLQGRIKRFQPVLSSAKSRDVNESDTVIIVTDMLQEIFGYDKYSEITSEHAIRGTFCDLATVLEGEIQFMIEVKAVGLELKDAFVKQAVDYAANKGVEWVVVDERCRVAGLQDIVVLLNDVLKREVVEGDKALDAQRKLNRCANKALRVRTGKDEQSEKEVAPAIAPQTISIPPTTGSQPVAGPAV